MADSTDFSKGIQGPLDPYASLGDTSYLGQSFATATATASGGGSFIGARFHAGTAQSIPNAQSNEVALNLDSQDYNVGGFVLASKVVTVPQTGYYRISATVTYASNSTGARWALIRINDASGSFVLYEGTGSGAAYGVTGITAYTELLLTIGYQVGVEVGQSSGGALNTTVTASEMSYLTISLSGT